MRKEKTLEILEILLLEPADDLPIASLPPEEEAALLGDAIDSQATTACPPRHGQWVSEPKDASKMMQTATESQGM